MNNKLLSCKITIILLILITFFGTYSCKQKDNSQDSAAIRLVMQKAQEGWNSGNLDEYMESYWKSDSLIFVGGKKISYGWNTTFKNYQKTYPDKSTMGKLTFSHIQIFFKNNNTAVITGAWKLTREKDILEGRYTLIFRKLPIGWRIVYDHSS